MRAPGALTLSVPSPRYECRKQGSAYRDAEDDIRIHESHRDSLFSRDLTGYAVIFLVVFGVAATLSALPWKDTGIYVGFLIIQYVALMIAARTYGVRLVCNVLAQQSAKSGGVT